MKHISEITDKNLTLTQPTGDPELSQGDKEFINAVFKKLANLKPAWKSAFRDSEHLQSVKKDWAIALVNNGITTPEHFKRGIAQAERDTGAFWPSVGQFIEWCKPDPNKLEEFKPRALLDNPAKPETVKQSISAMKELLK